MVRTVLALIGATILIVSCKAAEQGKSSSDPLPPVTIEPLADNVWLHTSYAQVGDWGAVPTNGLVVNDDQLGIVLIDTAWTNEQTETILSWARETFDEPVSLALFTHAHNDKMGGVSKLRDHGVFTFAHALSNEIAPTKGLSPAEFNIPFDDAGSWRIGEDLEVYYPGGGHTEDNIVVALSQQNVVFGGCLIRPGFSKSLGNTADANMDNWALSVRSVSTRFPAADTIVPSHGPPGGRELLTNTMSLASVETD